MAVSEDLELNIAPAVEQVEQLGQTIEATLSNAFASVGQTAQDVFATIGGDVAIEPDVSGVADAITSAIDAADTEFPLEPTGTETIPAEIQNAIALANSEVTLQADTDSIAPAIEEALDVVDPTIVVSTEVDTSGVEDGLAGVSEQADNATESVQGTSDALGAVQGASALAAGDLGGIAATLGAVTAKGSVTTGVILGVAGASVALVSGAIEADSALRQFDATFGGLAANIEKLDMGGLNTSLDDLALTLGSDDDEIRAVTASIGRFAIQAGATRKEAANFSEELITIAARAVAANPALGSIGQVVAQLPNALARGGPRLAQFGITLNKTQIDAEALRQNVGKAANELTVYDRATASATLVTKQFGNSTAAIVAEGADNPVVKLRSLRQAMEETQESLGKPLIGAGLTLFEEFQPIIEDLGTAVGSLARVALPLVAVSLRSLEPVLRVTANFMERVADGVEFLARAAASADDQLAKFFRTIKSSIKDVLEPLGKAVRAVGGFLEDLPGPNLLAPLGRALSGLGDDSKESGDKAAASAKGFKEQLESLGVLAGSVKATTDEMVELERASAGTSGALRNLMADSEAGGEILRGLSNELAQGALGFDDLSAALRAGLDAGELERFQAETQKAVDGIVSAFTSKLPTAAQATSEAVGNAIEATALRTEAAARRFGVGADDIAAALNKVKGTFNLKDVTADLEQQAKNIEGFFANMEIIATKHLDDTFAALAELGPVAGGKLAEELAKAGPKEQLQLEARLQRIKTANEDGERLFRDAAVSLPTLAQQAATAVNRAFGIMDLPGVISSQTLLAAQKLADINSDRASSPKAIASRGGLEIGISTAAGIATGIRSGQPQVNQAILAVINEAKKVAKGPRGLDSDSPSKVFAKMGEDIMAGLVIGVENGASSFDDAIAKALDVTALAIPTIEVPATIVPQVADVDLPTVNVAVQPATGAATPSARVPTEVSTAVSGGDSFTINAYYPTPEPISDLAPRALKRAQYTLGTVRSTNN